MKIGTDLVAQLELAESVGRLHMKGFSAADIASELDVPRRQVTVALRDWQNLLRQQAETGLEIKDKVMDILFETEESFRMAKKEAWSTVNQTDVAQQFSNKIAALKLYKDITKDIHDIFESAGVGQDVELIEEMHRTQQAQEELIKLLREIKTEFPDAAAAINRKLSKITGGEIEDIEVDSSQEAEIVE